MIKRAHIDNDCDVVAGWVGFLGEDARRVPVVEGGSISMKCLCGKINSHSLEAAGEIRVCSCGEKYMLNRNVYYKEEEAV